MKKFIKLTAFFMAAMLVFCAIGCHQNTSESESTTTTVDDKSGDASSSDSPDQTDDSSSDSGDGGDEQPVSTYIGTKTPSEAKAVGDIVFNDGSAVPYTAELVLTDEQKSKAIAVIFYVGTELNSGDDTLTIRTLGVGFTHGNKLEWCTESAKAYNKNIIAIQCSASGSAGALTFTGDKDGRDNISQIGPFLDDNFVADDTATEANYPAFYFAKNYASQSGSHVSGTDYADGWYMPTVAELFQIWKNRKTVDDVIRLCDGLEFGSDDFFISSSQYVSNNPFAYALNFTNGASEYCYKNFVDEVSVCAIRDFSPTDSQGGDSSGGATRPKVMGKIGKFGKPYIVGDIVFSDGSAQPYTGALELTDEQKNAAIAVIFYVGTELNDGDDTTTSRTLGMGFAQQTLTKSWEYYGLCLSEANAYDMIITTIICIPSDGYNGILSESYTFKGDKNGSNNFSQIGAFLVANGRTDDTDRSELYPVFYFAKNYASQDGSHVSGTDYADGWYVPTIAELYHIWKNRDMLDAASRFCGGPQKKDLQYFSSSQMFEEEGYWHNNDVFVWELGNCSYTLASKSSRGIYASAVREF